MWLALERCPHCGSEDIYFSKRRQLFVCEDCDGTMAPDPTSPIQLKLFFSYGHDDNAPIVERLRVDLEKRGHSVWMDTSAIRVGDDWRQAITQGLVDANSVLTFLSKHSVRTPGVCLDELRIALCVKSAAIKTVLLEEEAEVRVPSTLSGVQWLDMRDWRVRQQADPDAFDAWYQARFAELVAALESKDSLAFAGEITTLRELLAPHLSDAKESYLLRQDYVGREWLNDDLERWRTEETESKAFLLYGGPGLGKSRFAAQRLHYDPNILCGVFCEWDKETLRDVRGVVNTIAFRLATKLPDYRAILMATLRGSTTEQLNRLSDSERFDALLTYPLSQVIDGGRGRQLLLIDGLDEAEISGENYLAQVLAARMRDLPAWVGLVLTSRPESSVHAEFAGYHAREILPDDARNVDDIKQYLALQLKDQLADEPDKLGTLDRLTDAAEGSFLYATMFARDVQEHGLHPDPSGYFPQGLAGFYLTSLRRRFPSGQAFAGARVVLELVVAAGALPVSLLRDELNLTAYKIREFVESFGSLVLKSNDKRSESAMLLPVLSFFHKSIADWFTDPNRAGRYYVDGAAGAARLAKFALAHFDAGAERRWDMPGTEPASGGELSHKAYNSYLQRNIIRFLTDAQAWDNLELFLLDERTPLEPYWTALDSFPPTHDRVRLVERLWTHPGRDAFLTRLQRRGERSFVRFVMELLIERFGLDALTVDLVNIYVDVVHMGGEYAQAVEICLNYLAEVPAEEVLESEPLIHLAVRRLHHSMFFEPVDPLRSQAQDLIERVDAERFPDEYNELLFLLGGNLGLLSGDFESARAWVARSLSFARARGSVDFEERSLRKHLDLLCLDGRYDEAYEVATGLVTPGGRIETRYQVYLLGVLGEICRHRGMLAESAESFEALRQHSIHRGIPGWQAHSYLGKAMLLHDFGDHEDVFGLLDRAEAIYSRSGLRWGQVATALVRGLVLSAPGEDRGRTARSVCAPAAALARRLNYRYESAALDSLSRGGDAPGFHLLFL